MIENDFIVISSEATGKGRPEMYRTLLKTSGLALIALAVASGAPVLAGTAASQTSAVAATADDGIVTILEQSSTTTKKKKKKTPPSTAPSQQRGS